ncbi:DEAD/DEAH box helicase [Luteimonas salinilitoris]|uniref:DEAD/DEAH box helicase n=1 Tax=Luteimonas salinilitoris TaxID=3237697 RepID=A0ABV4HKM6_9GAMM
MPLDAFHPAVAAWFRGAFPAPTEAQAAAWPAIRAGRNTLVAAPTGSGKTLTAFMTAIDGLVRQGLQGAAPGLFGDQAPAAGLAGLPDETMVVYVSPLKALSNDIRVNLEAPLAGIRAELARMGLPDIDIRTAVRTGDTPQSERAGMRRRPPHILVTTPESLYVLLGSESGRAMLAPVRTVIVDEIHAVADDKRGSHLALSLERLEALCGRRLVRVGLSATQKPIDEVARFLVGAGNLLPRAESAEGSDSCRLPGSRHSGLPQAGEGEYGPCGTGSGRSAGAEVPVADCAIVDIGYTRQRDLALELPPTPLSVVMSNDQWEQVYRRVTELVEAHRTTLVFVNTRRMAERAARHLGELLGKEHVAAHHGSLAKERRLEAEQRLKRGELKVLVATASLELGIDIGAVDLVCQLGSPRSIATFLQRAGRSGHTVGGVPKARLFPATRDELVECAALLDCVRRGELDALRIPPAPLDVLAQQIVAEVASREWDEDALFDWLRRAWPYAQLAREDFDAVVRMLAEGYSSRRGPRAGYLHRDAVNRKLRGRKGARMTAVMSGGTIPDTGDYAVVLEPEAQNIGTVNEDFAVESMAGDIFQLGNASYRILRVEPGRVRVEDAQGLPPSIPFWIGEAPGRTDELSAGVSRLREEIAALLGPGLAANGSKSPSAPLFKRGGAGAGAELSPATDGAVPCEAPISGEVQSLRGPEESFGARVAPQAAEPAETRAVSASTEAAQSPAVPPFEKGGQGGFAPAHGDAIAWLRDELGLDADAARQLVDYLASAQSALGALPTQSRIVLERFFDESGGTQLVIHTPFGSRINRAWGLALRKRFCRKFNFELQAAATEDAIVLSLSTSHSFPLIEVSQYLHSASALDILVQALLDAPLFGARWRWNATTALALPRFQGGRKVPPQLQRMKSEDFLATVFPDQVACLENIVGEREVPDHPLVAQTLRDCLDEAMDAQGWLQLLRRMEAGEVEVRSCDLAAPSPLAAEAINARPYAFLDDAPLEERRTQAVQTRRYADPESAGDLGRLDADAIAEVRAQAWPEVRGADEMHDALMGLGAVTADEAAANAGWSGWLEMLARGHRATRLRPAPGRGELWVAAERLPQLHALFPQAFLQPCIEAPAEYATQPWAAEDAATELLRARLSGLGPVPAAELARSLSLPPLDADVALLRLQNEGYAMQGRFTPGTTETEWCERYLLARIHRYTLGRLRREIEPVPPRDFLRFLLDWQRVSGDARASGPEALAGVLSQLEGFEAPAAAWESELLPARVRDYSISWLDELCTAGRTLWTRLRASDAEAGAGRGSGTVRTTPVVLLPRRTAAHWMRLAPDSAGDAALSSRAQRVADHLAANGASFFDEIATGTRLLQIELEDALAELVARGRARCDSFAGLRALLVPASKRSSARGRGRRRAALFGIEDAGRWAPCGRRAGVDTPSVEADVRAASLATAESLEHVARVLLRRYGVVCWRLLEREAAWLPPWRELSRVYRRLEARGEIRGGRFIAGLSGEQFALPEAIGLLRRIRRKPGAGEFVCLSAMDPLNLVGTLLPGDRIPRLPGARVLYRDGLPVGSLVAGQVALLTELAPAEEHAARRILLRELASDPGALPVGTCTDAPVPVKPATSPS